MLKSIYLLLILFNAVLQLYAVAAAVEDKVAAAAAIDAPTHHDDSNNCRSNALDQSLYCRGSRAIRNVFNNLNKSDAPLVIVRGLEIVRSHRNVSDSPADYYSNAIDDDSFLGRFSEYLRTHELNIKFSELLAEESERVSARDLEKNGMEIGSKIDDFGRGVEEARKKDKGQGVLMAMALMFGKIMAVMGLGGIGALAMKALGVAMAALMMAGIVGLKSLSQQGGGHESKHSVQYLTADGHPSRRRRRRSVDLMKQLYGGRKRTNDAYRGWLRGGNEIAK